MIPHIYQRQLKAAGKQASNTGAPAAASAQSRTATNQNVVRDSGVYANVCILLYLNLFQGQLHLSNGQDDFLAQLERKAQSEGLQFIEELVFENGAVYKGKKTIPISSMQDIFVME